MKRISDMTDKEFAAFNDDEEQYRRDALEFDLMANHDDDWAGSGYTQVTSEHWAEECDNYSADPAPYEVVECDIVSYYPPEVAAAALMHVWGQYNAAYENMEPPF